MNKRAKGQYNERLVKKLFEERGYKVFKPTWNKFTKNKDIFGVADLLALHQEKKELIFIQVKSNKKDLRGAVEKFKEIMPCVSKVIQEVWWGLTPYSSVIISYK